MSWNHPILFWGFVGAILIYYFVARSRSRRELALRQSFGDGMRSCLFPERSVVLTTIKRSALLFSIFFLLTALCGPRYGREAETQTSFGRDIFVVFDVSDSMLAEDVSPNRLSVAKLDVEDLLDVAFGDRVGLITFSGSAQVEIPLTTDYEFFRSLLRKADPSSIKLGGTAIGDAIRLALERFDQSAEREKAIVLITDGEDHDSLPLEAARQAAELNAPIYAIAIGSKTGARIPVFDVAGRQVGYKRFDGEEVVSKPDVTLLKEMAKLSNGRFFYADSQLDLGDVYRNVIDAQRRSELSETKRIKLKERYQTFLVLGLISFFVYYVTPGYRRKPEPRSPFAPRPLVFLIAALLSTACSSNFLLFAADGKTGDEIEAYNRSLEYATAGNIDEFISRQQTLSSARSDVVAERANYNLGVEALNRAQKLAKEFDEKITANHDNGTTQKNEVSAPSENSGAVRINEYNEARGQRQQMNAEILGATRDSARSFIKSAERNPESQRAQMVAQAVLNSYVQRQRDQEELEKKLRYEALGHDDDHATWLCDELNSQIEHVRKIEESDVSPDYFRSLDAQRVQVLSVKNDLEAITSRLTNQQKNVVSQSPLLENNGATDSIEPQADPLLDEESLSAIARAQKEYESKIETAAQCFADYEANRALDEIHQASSQLELVKAVATNYDKLVLMLETSEQVRESQITGESTLASPSELDDYHWSRDALKLAVGEMLRKAGQIVDRSATAGDNAVQTTLPNETPITADDEDAIKFDSNEVDPTDETSREARILESALIAQDLGNELVDSIDELQRLTHNRISLIPDDRETVVKRQIRVTEILHRIAEPLKEDAQQNDQLPQNQNDQQKQENQPGQKNQDNSQSNDKETPNEINSPDENPQKSQDEKDSKEEEDNQKKQEAELEEKMESKKRSSQTPDEKTEGQTEADSLIKLVERRQKDAEQERRAIQQALKRKDKSGKDW